MLSEQMIKSLNDQINLEFYSSNIYLQMSSWCEYKGLDGCAEFLRAHAVEEMGHMQKLFNYVNETGAMAVIGGIEAPASHYEGVEDIFTQILDHEKLVTSKINELVHLAFTTQDYSTFNFLQWYVAEQHEEEKLFNSILDKVKMIGAEGKGLYFIDQEIARQASIHEANEGAPA
ncbi:non-heme ferritin [Sansalvadorimonas sp. 2012CJ34-2]|uniref:Ferritin n=1 Tax=Parendozoicomonas callyspongiae TaxID=2942213 RepID=A0ABT0PIV4_9GAMM|nr:non-heme ferritin [Sansalvadorimonas sp. 2012CJ34-2]MCL6271293.1 non-heme ferritin [Sansalvadorimonas sp. 2012CJ34-2]